MSKIAWKKNIKRFLTTTMNCFHFKGQSQSKQDMESHPKLERRDIPMTLRVSKQTVKSPTLSSLPSTPGSIAELSKEKAHTLRVFSYEELRQATKGFSRKLIIGEGGFGIVYKGTVRAVNGSSKPLIVAIKVLKGNSSQGQREWMSEVQFLSVVNHPNLIKLIGYCSSETERGVRLLLVYEYMANRSLDCHLFNVAQPSIPWKKRLEIILGAAQGLAYLHEGMEVKVIFRDFKSSNVMLDEKFNAKLSDFGFAREGPAGDRTHVTTRILGTYGYAPPEYLETGHLRVYSDVWTFGVVLYEILTGRQALDRNRPSEERKLLDWVRNFPVDSQEFTEIIDPRLRTQCPISSAREVAKLAQMCLKKNHEDRPAMCQMVSALKDAIRDCPEASSSSRGRWNF